MINFQITFNSRLIGGRLRNLLGTDPSHPGPEITETLQRNDSHRFHPNIESMSGVFELVSQSFPVRFPLGKLPKSFSKSHVVWTTVDILQRHHSRHEVDEDRHASWQRCNIEC